MKVITQYQADDGSLHDTPEQAIKREKERRLERLICAWKVGPWTTASCVAFILQHPEEIFNILNENDIVE